jgi:archaellum component FlaC
MAKLELCGVSLDLQALDDAQKAIEDALAELTSGAGGIADAIGDLQNQLGSALDDALADLENLIPEIKIEFPNLQKEINELLELLADPFKALEIQKQIDKIRELFGDSDFDIDGILSDITNGLSDIAGGLSEFTGDITKALGDLAGTLSSFDPCKLVPNMDAEPQYDEFGDVIGYEYKTKAYVPDAPITDAVSLLPDEEAFGDDEVILDDVDVVSKAKPTVKTFTDTVTSVLSGLATPVVDLIPTPAKIESLTLPEVMGGGEIKFRDVGSQLAPAPEELKNKLEIPKSKLIANAYTDALANERNGGLNFGELQQIDVLKSTLPIQYKVEKAREAAGIASNVKAVVTERFSKVAFDAITGTAAQTAQAAFSAANINNIGLDDLSPNIATKVAKSLGIPYIPKFPSINAGKTIESVTNITASLNVPSNATPSLVAKQMILRSKMRQTVLMMRMLQQLKLLQLNILFNLPCQVHLVRYKKCLHQKAIEVKKNLKLVMLKLLPRKRR